LYDRATVVETFTYSELVRLDSRKSMKFRKITSLSSDKRDSLGAKAMQAETVGSRMGMVAFPGMG